LFIIDDKFFWIGEEKIMTRKKHSVLICSLLLLCLVGCNKTTPLLLEIPELNFFIVGGTEERNARFGADFSSIFKELNEDKQALDAFLFNIAMQPRSKKEITKASNFLKSKLETLISGCQSINLIREKEGKWATTVPVVTDRQMLLIKQNLTLLARSLADEVRTAIPEIRILYESEKATSDPSWNDVTHLIIDKFLVDGTFHAAIEDLEQEKTGQKFYSQDQKTLPAFFLEQGEHTANFGCNWYRFQQDNDLREIYILHGTLLKRIDIPMNKYRNDQDFASSLFKISPIGDHSSLSESELEAFRDLGWLGDERLLIPVLHADHIRKIMPLIGKTGKEMAEMVYANYSIFLDSFEGSPYSQFLDGAGDYIQACYHVLFSLIVDKLVEEHVIPPVPYPVPESFGVFMTLGSVWE
jgi:hypothetical protein